MNILYYIIIFLIITIIILIIYIIQKLNNKKQKINELKINIEKLEETRKKVDFIKSLERSKKELEKFDVVGNSFSKLYLARKDLFRIDLVKISLHNLNPKTIKNLLLKAYTYEIAKINNELQDC